MIYKNFLCRYRGRTPQGKEGYQIFDLKGGLIYRPSIKYLIVDTVEDVYKWIDEFIGEVPESQETLTHYFY